MIIVSSKEEAEKWLAIYNLELQEIAERRKKYKEKSSDMALKYRNKEITDDTYMEFLRKARHIEVLDKWTEPKIKEQIVSITIDPILNCKN